MYVLYARYDFDFIQSEALLLRLGLRSSSCNAFSNCLYSVESVMLYQQCSSDLLAKVYPCSDFPIISRHSFLWSLCIPGTWYSKGSPFPVLEKNFNGINFFLFQFFVYVRQFFIRNGGNLENSIFNSAINPWPGYDRVIEYKSNLPACCSFCFFRPFIHFVFTDLPANCIFLRIVCLQSKENEIFSCHDRFLGDTVCLFG